MPSQLFNRLQNVLDASIARTINALERPAGHHDLTDTPITDAVLHDGTVHPPAGLQNTHERWSYGAPAWGEPVTNFQSIVIHGTGGWPSIASRDHFSERYRCISHETGYVNFRGPWADPTLGRARWVDADWGIGPQYFIDSSGTICVLIGPENLDGPPRRTWHGELQNTASLGIENADYADQESGPPLHIPFNPDTNTACHRLDSTKAATESDLTGMKVFGVLHPSSDNADLNLIWFALFPGDDSGYRGPGDLAANSRSLATGWGSWRNSLFTERNYRSLVLLCRFVLEQTGIPRSFPLLPYANVDHRTANIFRKLLLADPARDQIARQLGLNVGDVRANNTTYQGAYSSHAGTLWNGLFGVGAGGALSTPCFKGFISHYINGHHACPGPLFDWHRFAREVWDWWWYPFDVSVQILDETGLHSLETATTRRAYQHARADTPLIEYFFDAGGTRADYESLMVPGTTNRFAVGRNVPVHALANGVIVAARFPAPLDGPDELAPPGFLLTRHEVFHENAAAIPGGDSEDIILPGTGLLFYNSAPTYVWSLITYVSPIDVDVEQLSDNNPDWLNRFIMRLKECELAVAFHHAHPNEPTTVAAEQRLRRTLNTAWNHPPPGIGRPTSGAAIDNDAREYRRIADALHAGEATNFPLENGTYTPVRLILGDYLGLPELLTNFHPGFQIEVFSRKPLDVPGADEGTVSASGEDWWRDASAVARSEANAAANLPQDGQVHRYPTPAFLAWINGITWTSEWLKYGINDPANPTKPLPMPRPNPRINL